MFVWENKIPSHQVKKTNIITTVIFTAVFALVFINVYSPFSVNKWFHLKSIELFFYSSLVILTGMLVIVISRILLYYRCKRFGNINYLQYAIWILLEVISMAVFYTLFVRYILNDTRDFLLIFKVSIRNTALVLFLPYSILWLYFSWRDKSETLEKLKSEDAPPPVNRKMIAFYDEQGKLRLSVKHEDIVYLESADNYVSIHYQDKGKTIKFMLRNSLKNLEELLKHRNIIRTHRSYMVNFDKVKLIRKEKDGLHFELDVEEKIDLPISKTYMTEVIKSFSDSIPEN